MRAARIKEHGLWQTSYGTRRRQGRIWSSTGSTSRPPRLCSSIRQRSSSPMTAIRTRRGGAPSDLRTAGCFLWCSRSETTMSLASSRRGKRTSVKKEPTLVRRRLKYGQWYAVDADGNERLLPPERSKTDWARLDAMTDEEVLAAARSD